MIFRLIGDFSEESGCRSDQSDQFFRSIQLSFGTFIMKYMRYKVKKLKVLGYSKIKIKLKFVLM